MSARKTKLTSMLVLMIGLMTMFFVQTVSAQETRGIIRGTVTDPNGAAVVGATVTITDIERGRKVTLTTNDEGFYQAPYLIAGKFQVVAEAAGFKKTVNESVLLQINETLQINLKLEVGQPVETVTVTSDSQPLQTETASLGLVIDQRRIEELPLVHGDPYTLIGSAPGVAHTGSQRLDRPFEPTHIVGYAMDGTRGNRSDLTIDGAPSTSTADPNQVIASYVPPTDIIGEFKVQTATFDAQFGNTEGGVTSISIKSGTNKLHGAAYYFAEPGSWAANDFFGNRSGTPRPETKSDRFGFSANGPVRIPWLYNGKDKTFFLFGYEGIRDSRPRFDASNVWVPTAAMRAGDFSAFLCPPPPAQPVNCQNIFDPNTRVNIGTVASPVWSGTQFPGNVIPDARISPIAKAILTNYAAPKAPGLLNNINDSTLTEKTKPYDNYTFRVDQNITDNNHLFVRGSWYNRNSNYNDYLASPATGVTFIFASRQGVIDDVHTFDPTTFLNVRYAYNRFIRETDQDPDARSYDLTQLGWSSAYNNLIPEEMRRFPRFDFPSPGTLGTGYGNEFRPTDTHSVAATMTKIYNTHSIKFGGEVRVYREDSTFQSNDQTGQFIFNNTFTRQASGGVNALADFNGVGAFASFLLGLPSTQQIVRRADYSEVSKTWGFFVHDDWKVNRKLTLNLGLRYEIESPMIERNNKSVVGFDPNYVQSMEAAVRAQLQAVPVGASADGLPAINASTFNVRGALTFASEDNPALYKTPKNTFLPRVGFAYQASDKLVFRGGFGIFAGFLGQRRGDVIQPGFTETSAIPTTTLPNNSPIPVNIAQFPTSIIINEPVGAARGALTSLGGGISYFNQNPAVSKQARSQIGLQYQLPWGIVAEAVYVNNYGYDIEIVRNINAVPNQFLNADNFRSPAMIARNTSLTGNVSNPFVGQASFLPGNAFRTSGTIARSQLLRPFPAFGDINTTNNDGKSWYNSGQFTLNKRMTEGFTIQAAYTWSKWIQQTEYLNPSDELPTKVISDLDVPHRLSASMMYELPFGKGKMFLSGANGIVDRIVNGWQFGAVYAFQTGFPVAFGNLFYNGGDIAIEPADRTTAMWFNTSVFTTASNAQPQSNLRTFALRFSDVRRDNINNFDFSVKKDIRLKESMKIQIRFELINALNEPYFPAPIVAIGSTFGQVSASNLENYARRAQFGLKFVF